MFTEYVAADEQRERCGLFLKLPNTFSAPHTSTTDPSRLVDMIVELPNRADDDLDNFVIHQSDVDRALKWLRRSRRDILGFWHTHPAGSMRGPSQPDLDSVSLGDKGWWHCVYVCEVGVLSWYDYYENKVAFLDTGGAVPWKFVVVRSTTGKALGKKRTHRKMKTGEQESTR